MKFDRKLILVFALCVSIVLNFFCSLDDGNTDKNEESIVDNDLGFSVFPPDNPWNTDISNYSIDSNSDNYIKEIGENTSLHPDFGTVYEGAPNGIPYRIVDGNQEKVKITYTAYGDESDSGPFPIPNDFVVEGGNDSDGDRHVIVIDKNDKILYELYRAFKVNDGWEAESGAKWDLTSNDLRPKYWTSADAAGLPIFPGLVRYEEVEKGEINHALRFTVSKSQRGFITPARHYASHSNNPDYAPMGLRLRLKAGFDISGFSEKNQIILKCLKKYGMFVADNGGDLFLSGAPDTRWNDEELSELHKIKANDFEVVHTGEIEN